MINPSPRSGSRFVVVLAGFYVGALLSSSPSSAATALAEPETGLHEAERHFGRASRFISRPTTMARSSSSRARTRWLRTASCCSTSVRPSFSSATMPPRWDVPAIPVGGSGQRQASADRRAQHQGAEHAGRAVARRHGPAGRGGQHQRPLAGETPFQKAEIMGTGRLTVRAEHARPSGNRAPGRRRGRRRRPGDHGDPPPTGDQCGSGGCDGTDGGRASGPAVDREQVVGVAARWMGGNRRPRRRGGHLWPAGAQRIE